MKFKKGDIVLGCGNQYKVIRSYYSPDDPEKEKEYVDLISVEGSDHFKKIYDPDLKLIKRKIGGHHLTNIFK